MESGEDLDSLTTMEVLKSKNKDMMMEVTFLKDLIFMKNEESSKIKAELFKKKKVNSELSELVLKLKEQIPRQKSQNDGESEDTDENENHRKPFIRSSRRKCHLPSFNSGCKRQASSSPDDVRSSKRMTRSNSTFTSDIFDSLLHTPTSKSIRFVKSGGKRRANPSPDETISYNRITRSSSKRITCTGEILDPLPHTPKPNSSFSFKASSGSRQKKIVNNPYFSDVESSSCSEGGHVETYRDSLYPKVNFTIVTEEKNSFGKHIHDLKCAMRPQVTVKQVKRSFCKRMGIDRDKISLILFGDDVFDEMEMSDDLTIQVCEGRIVVAVKKVKEVEMERDSTAKGVKNINQVQGNFSGEILTEVEKSVNVVIKNPESVKELHVEESDNPKDVSLSNDKEEIVEEEARTESLKEHSWKLWRECGDKDFDTFSFDYRFFHVRMANLKMIGILVDELVSSVVID